METRTFGSTGLEVSVLGFGGAPIGFLEAEQRQVTALLNTLLDEGVNLLDTAMLYMGSEELIGKAVSHRRDEFVLVTKCVNPMDPSPAAWSADAVAQAVDQALVRLRTDHLDVMLLHSCGLDTLEQGDALGALVRARQAGKIRFAGYSGDNETLAYAAALPDVAVIETSLNICDQANLASGLPKAKERELGVIAKRPLANAAWKDLSEQQGMYTDYAKPYTDRFAGMGLTPADLGFEGAPPRDLARDCPAVHTVAARRAHRHHWDNQRGSRKGKPPGSGQRTTPAGRAGQDPRGLPAGRDRVGSAVGRRDLTEGALRPRAETE